MHFHVWFLIFQGDFYIGKQPTEGLDNRNRRLPGSMKREPTDFRFLEVVSIPLRAPMTKTPAIPIAMRVLLFRMRGEVPGTHNVNDSRLGYDSIEVERQVVVRPHCLAQQVEQLFGSGYRYGVSL